MGIFDSTSIPNFKNEILDNIDPEDGVYNVECKKTCRFRDIENNRCLFETCQVDNNPKMHKKFVHNCYLCNKQYAIDTDTYKYNTDRINFDICPECIAKLKLLMNRTVL